MREEAMCVRIENTMARATLIAANKLVDCLSLRDWIRWAWVSKGYAWMQGRHQIAEIALSRSPYSQDHVYAPEAAQRGRELWGDRVWDALDRGPPPSWGTASSSIEAFRPM